jgi:polar amino acid transport system substrate-binding protein
VPHSLADLKKLQTCAQTDTTGLQYIQDQLNPNTAPLQYPTTTGAYTSVANGTCQAFILDVPLVLLEKKQYPSRFGPVAGQIVTHEQYGAVLQKGSSLTAKLNQIMSKFTTDGTIANLQKKWFKISFTAIPTLR